MKVVPARFSSLSNLNFKTLNLISYFKEIFINKNIRRVYRKKYRVVKKNWAVIVECLQEEKDQNVKITHKFFFLIEEGYKDVVS